jgi:hypothetical protein
MSGRWAAIFCTFLLCSCYGSSRIGGPGDGGEDPDGSTLPDGAPWPDSGVWWPDAAPPDVGPACPDPGPPIIDWECDILTQEGCPPFYGCYGWTETSSDPCATEIYRSSCLPAGAGRDGDPCSDAAGCAPGLECFITGEGTQCLPVCDPHGGEPRCPPALICRPTDLPGLGACA